MQPLSSALVACDLSVILGLASGEGQFVELIATCRHLDRVAAGLISLTIPS